MSFNRSESVTRYTLTLVLVLVIVPCILGLSWRMYLLINDLHKSVSILTPATLTMMQNIQAIETNTTRTEAEMAGLLNTTRHIAIAEEKAQEQQIQSVQELTTKAYALLDDADQTVKGMGEISPAVAEAIKSTSEDLHSTLYSSQRLMESATDDISSPSIKGTMDNLQEASKNTATTTQNIADTTKDIKEYVHRETTPVRGTWNFIKELINQVWAIRGAAGI